MRNLTKKITRPMCLMLSIALLGSAMAFAALTGSPYDAAKEAAYNLLANGIADDYAVKAEFYVNDVLYSSDNMVALDGRYISYGMDGGVSYSDGSLSLYMDNGVGSGSVTYNPYTHDYENTFAQEYPRNSTYVRLAEALLDTLVGDLKNHLSLSGLGDERVLSGVLTAGQIPELYNLLLSMALAESTSSHYQYDSSNWTARTPGTEYEDIYLEGLTKTVNTYRIDEDYNSILINQRVIEATREDYGDGLFDAPIAEAAIDYVSGRATLDRDNRLIEGSLAGRVIITDIFGETFTLEGTIDYSAREEDLITPECPLPNAEELLSADALYPQLNEATRAIIDSGEYAIVHYNFETDASGSILPESLTVSDYYNYDRLMFGVSVVADPQGNAELQFEYQGMLMTYDELLTRISDGEAELEKLFWDYTGLMPGVPYQELCELYGIEYTEMTDEIPEDAEDAEDADDIEDPVDTEDAGE